MIINKITLKYHVEKQFYSIVCIFPFFVQTFSSIAIFCALFFSARAKKGDYSDLAFDCEVTFCEYWFDASRNTWNVYEIHNK